MKKLLYGLLVLLVASIAIANPGNLGVFQTKSWIGFPIYSLDTLTGQWRRPDSVYLHIFYGRLANLPSFTTRVASDFVAASWLDSMKISSMTNPIYTFHDSVGRIDADSGNGNYWGLLQTFYQTKTTDFTFEFAITDSSQATMYNKASRDSAIVDGSILAGLTGAISATTIAADAIGSSELATDAIGAAEVAADAIGASELATDAIGAGEIAADAIGSSELATDAITATEIAADAIAASEIAANAIGASEVATGAIIMGAEIDTTGLAASVWAHGTKILTALDEDNTVMDLNATTIGTATNVTTLNGIAADVITASSIATDAIGAAEIAANAIGASEVATGAIVFGVEFDTTGSGFSKAKAAADTLIAHAPHANNWGGTAAGSGVNADTVRDILGDSLATFLTARQMRDTVWLAAGSRNLTSLDEDSTQIDLNGSRIFSLMEFDEDNTTLDINGTTIGTATNVTTLNGIASGVITATSIATDAITSAEIADNAIDAGAIATDAITAAKIAADAIGASEIAADAIGSSELATTAAGEIVDANWDEVIGGSHEISGSSGKLILDDNAYGLDLYSNGVKLKATGTDADTSFANLQTAVAAITGGGTADIYPLLGPKFVVDAVGADGNSQFVVDTTSLGVFSSDQDALINRAIIIRSLTGAEVSLPTTITRVAYTAANCSITVSIDAPKNFAANDTIQFTGLPWHDFATLAEASDSGAIALLETDTTGHGADNTVGKAIQTGGSAATDTTATKQMMINMGVKVSVDSIAKLAQTTTGAGTLRRGEVPSLANMSDSVRDIVDDISCSGSGTCLGAGYANACTLYVFHNSTPIEMVYVKVSNSSENAVMARNFTDANGRVIFNLDTAITYKVRVQRANINQITNPQSVTLTTNGANDTILVNTTPLSNEAVIIGNLDCVDCNVRFALESNGQPVTDTSTNRLITRRIVDLKTDSDGFLTTTLPKTGNLLYPSGTTGRLQPKWKVTVSKTNVSKEPLWSIPFAIPSDSSQIDIGELIQ